MRNQCSSAQPYPSWPNSPARRLAAGNRWSKGVALIFVLWLMTILSALALRLSFSSHLQVQVAADLSGGTKALFLARAGVNQAIADLLQSRDEIQSLLDLRDGELHAYRNAEVGEGTFTLFAETDAAGDPVCGIIDEAAKINVNSAGADILVKLPGMTDSFAAQIVAARGEQGFPHLNDLLTLDDCDLQTLYGEDRNHNAILDPNENDGDESWPPDNADDLLDRGLAAYLTIYSASRNISPQGEKRVNINSANAQTLTSSVPEMTEQEAQSIIQHRSGNQFSSIADLLDVDLFEQVTSRSEDRSSGNSDADGKRTSRNNSSNSDSGRGGRSGRDSSGNDRSEGRDNSTLSPRRSDGNQSGNQQPQYKSTGQKAFDTEKFRKFAPYLTTKDDEMIKGLVNINTAPYEVVVSLAGIDESLAQQIVKYREGTSEGFQSVADLLSVSGLTTSTLKQVCAHVDVRSDVFTVRSFGVLASQDMYRCVEAVIDRTQDTIAIKSWRELE